MISIFLPATVFHVRFHAAVDLLAVLRERAGELGDQTDLDHALRLRNADSSKREGASDEGASCIDDTHCLTSISL
jgi:hypothetical protein